MAGGAGFGGASPVLSRMPVVKKSKTIRDQIHGDMYVEEDSSILYYSLL
jgi:hypothetical protein